MTNPVQRQNLTSESYTTIYTRSFQTLQCRGHEGIDFDTNLVIDTVDFGTFHVSYFPSFLVFREMLNLYLSHLVLPRFVGSR